MAVVIPVYNRPFLVRDALESVFLQTCQPAEILVVDDGSEEDLAGVLSPYLSRILLIREAKNRGVSAARNSGVARSSARYIAFLDSDDLWLPEKLALQMDYIIRENVTLCHTDEYWLRKGKWVNQGTQHAKYGGDIFCSILDKCRISPSSVILERKTFLQAGGFDENLKVCEDYELFLRLALTEQVGYFPRKLIVKRAGAANSLSASIDYIESIRLEILEKFAEKQLLTECQRRCLEDELRRKRKIVKKIS